MSSQKTTNLLLHSWIGTDKVSRTEFNFNFQTIDTAIKNLQTATENISGDAAEIAIADAGLYYQGTNVEEALQEIGLMLAGAKSTLLAETNKLLRL